MSDQRLFRHYWISQDRDGNPVTLLRSEGEISVLAFDTRRECFVQCRLLTQAKASATQLSAQATAVRQAGQPSLATLLEWGEDDGHWYVIAAHVDGPSLGDYLNRDLQISSSQAAAISLQALAATQATVDLLPACQDQPLNRLRVVASDHALGLEVVMAHPNLDSPPAQRQGTDLTQSARPLLQGLNRQAQLPMRELAAWLEPCLTCLWEGGMAALPALRTSLMQHLRAQQTLPEPCSQLESCLETMAGDILTSLPEALVGDVALARLGRREAQLESLAQPTWLYRPTKPSPHASDFQDLSHWLRRQKESLRWEEILLLLSSTDEAMRQAEQAGCDLPDLRVEDLMLIWSRDPAQTPQLALVLEPSVMAMGWRGLRLSQWIADPSLQLRQQGAWLAALALALHSHTDPQSMSIEAARPPWNQWLRSSDSRLALLQRMEAPDPHRSRRMNDSIATPPQDVAPEPEAIDAGFAELLFKSGAETSPVVEPPTDSSPSWPPLHGLAQSAEIQPENDPWEAESSDGNFLYKAFIFIVLSLISGWLLAKLHPSPGAALIPFAQPHAPRQLTSPEALPLPEVMAAPAPVGDRLPALPMPSLKPAETLRRELQRQEQAQGERKQSR